MIFFAVMTLPLISTEYGDKILASPISQFTPRLSNLSTESWGSIFLMICCTRSMTSANSKSAIIGLKPRDRLRVISAASFAERMRDLLGTHPVLRQSPPILCLSISVTSPLTVATIRAATSPPEPAPMTITF